MAEKKRYTPVERVAQVISDLFSPIVLPAYMMAVALWFTPLVFAAEKLRLVTMAVVIVLTAVVPTAVIVTLIKLGKVKDVSLSSRSERPIPYVVGIVCYLITALFLNILNAPTWLSAFYMGAALTSILACLITYRWKISAHSSATGGVAAALVWMSGCGLLFGGPMLWSSIGVLLCGLVASSRLILLRHTPAQVYAGLALGFAAVTAMIFTL